ncbi:hypothetical protein [Nonomuraea sp. NPDC049141]|uniref:hypothetical protein n=1 Tax=Nonomuraea sp. NPDC049141 TaxID=3155500 RepID=UPI0033FF8B7E
MSFAVNRVSRVVGLGLAMALAVSMSSSVTAQALAEPLPTAKPVANVTVEKVKLYALVTTNNKGVFYTASESEKQRAIQTHGFSPTDTQLGYISGRPFPGGKPMWRLKYKLYASYLVTGSPSERDSLVNSGKFVNEGILGYAAASPIAGTTKIYRLSKKNYGWRLATEAHKDNILAANEGWHVDGPIYYHFTSGE